MTRAARPCVNHAGQSAGWVVRARYWFGFGPTLDLCDPCAAAMCRAVEHRARATGFAARTEVFPIVPATRARPAG